MPVSRATMSCVASAATASISARAADTASRIFASAGSTLSSILSAAFLTLASVAWRFLPSLLREPGRLGAGRVHARAPGGFRLLGAGASGLCALEVLADLLLALVDRRLDLRQHPPPMPKKMMPNTTASQKSCEAKTYERLRDLRHSGPPYGLSDQRA
jgi:hypothetical protein